MDQKHWDKAEQLLLQAIEGQKKVLNADHPYMMDSTRNMALIYWHQDRRVEAIDLMRLVVELREKTIGKEHPHTIASKAWSAPSLDPAKALDVANESQ